MNTKQATHVELHGAVAFDPEIREIAKGRKVARLSLVTVNYYLNADKERITDTQYHTIVAWGHTAEQVEQLLRKGSGITLKGRSVQRSYNGSDRTTRHVTEIVMNEFKFSKAPQP